MTTELKVGQRIDVYKVLTDGSYTGGAFTPGTWRVGYPLSPSFTEVIVDKKHGSKTLAMEYHNEVKKVGTLIIKTIKNDNSL